MPIISVGGNNVDPSFSVEAVEESPAIFGFPSIVIQDLDTEVSATSFNIFVE